MSELIDIKAPEEQEEGTFSVLKTWLKGEGDTVAQDEPVAELETDKVALEVAAPAAGVIAEILLAPDAEVAPGMVMARIKPQAGAAETAATAKAGANGQAAPQADGAAGTTGITAPPVDAPEKRLSPAVRRLATENNLDENDLARIDGSGRGGRITRADVEAFLRGEARQRADYVFEEQFVPSADQLDRLRGDPEKKARPSADGARSRHLPLNSMRRSIANHMVKSVTVAPHVTALFEADLSAITAHRKKHKEAFKAKGLNLTYTAYFVAAAVAAMRAVPQVNSRLHDESLEIFDDINIGIGTALGEKGLIVPVIHQAQALNLEGLAARLQDLTERARTSKLTKTDIQGGTFSISNHGVSGSLLAAPIIINQPQSAILGLGKMEKRVVVREVDGADAMIIKPMAYVTLTIDHRVLDAHQCNAWLTAFVEAIETWT